jgi:hypothetical protein
MKITSIVLGSLLILGIVGCADTRPPTADQLQTAQQEAILQEGSAQTGMPAIKNFRERKMLKQILEERDQANFVTYTYLENLMPKSVPGITALGGKLTYVGVSIGYPIPYSTQYTSPEKPYSGNYSTTYYGYAMPQADPNGLFSAASAEGSWIELKTPDGQSHPQYFEPRLVTLTYKLPFDN